MPRDHAQRMYEEAFLPVSCRSGTPYPCAQSEIDITNSHNVYPYVGGTQTTEYGAAQEIVGHNSMYRVPGSLEEEAIINLQYMRRALRAQHDEFGPDLAIKVFRDLDRVFFAGKLYGRCSVQWDDLDEVYATAYSLLRRPGVALILLSVRGIILMTPKDAMLRQLFKTLLHEMCHCYFYVRTPQNERSPDGHGAHFTTMIRAVSRRSMELLGFPATTPDDFFYEYQH